MKKVLLGGGVTQEVFDSWKQKYGVIHQISVVVKKATPGQEADIAVGYIRDVNEDLDMVCNVLSMQASGKILECKIFLLENSFLGGDSRIHGDNAVSSIKIGAATQAGKTITVLEGALEKL